MNEENRKQLRSMVHLLPELVEGSLLNQALEVRNIVTSTFEFSPDFMATMRNTPQNYIEKVQSVYADMMFKAFDAGLAAAKTKGDELLPLFPIKTVAEPSEELIQALDQQLKVNMPMPYGFSQDLRTQFESEVKNLLSTTPDSSDIYAQFMIDLDAAYRMGIKDYVEANNLWKVAEPVTAPEPAAEEAPAPAATEAPPAQEQAPAAASTTAVTAMNREDIIAKIEEYTKLLGDNTLAEVVLRATMGLSPKSVPITAETSTEKVGPFDVAVVKDQVLSALRTLKMEDGPQQVVCLEKILPGIDKMEGADVAKALLQKLELQEYVADGDPSLASVEEAADVMADTLTDCLALPGTVVLMEYQGDYCLLFTFDKANAMELGLEANTITAKKKSKAEGPGEPGGTLSVGEQKEIQALSDLSKSKGLSGLSLKEIKKASPEMGHHISNILSDARKGNTLRDISRDLVSKLEDAVETVFGVDGLSYLLYIKGR